MLKIKRILNDIVIHTYGSDCNPAYLKFYVEISNKNSASRHGFYRFKDHKIVILNTYRDDETILITLIHELAHHIDYCNRKTSNHQAPFYEEYKKLLFTALDMGVIQKEKVLETERDASDSNKVKKMINAYEPHPVEYKSDATTVSVYDCFDVKDYLKNAGYHFNGNTKAWEKETNDPEKETEWLKRFKGIRVEISKATDLHFSGKIKLIAGGDTYSIKEELKAAGFRFENKAWVYYAKDKDDVKRMVSKFPGILFSTK